MKTILFAGGGSGGHVAPVLAVMKAVTDQAPGIRCCFVGLPSDLSSPLIVHSDLKFEKYSIEAGKLNRFITIKQFGEFWKMLKGLWMADRLIKHLKPSIVFAKGGFVTVPIVLAAKRRKIPIYTHETDAYPGLANQMNAKYAESIFTSFPIEAYQDAKIDSKKMLFVGQPVREEFYLEYDLEQPLIISGQEIPRSFPIITVIGGSLGAKGINDLVSEAYPALLKKYVLVHICGKHQYEELSNIKKKLPPGEAGNLFLFEFINQELPILFKRSKIVISRAGGTIFELAACGVPALLIPLPTAAQDHQRKNAKFLMENDAVYVLDEVGANAIKLIEILDKMQEDPANLELIGQRIHQLANPRAAEAMAEYLLREEL